MDYQMLKRRGYKYITYEKILGECAHKELPEKFGESSLEGGWLSEEWIPLPNSCLLNKDTSIIVKIEDVCKTDYAPRVEKIIKTENIQNITTSLINELMKD